MPAAVRWEGLVVAKESGNDRGWGIWGLPGEEGGNIGLRRGKCGLSCPKSALKGIRNDITSVPPVRVLILLYYPAPNKSSKY